MMREGITALIAAHPQRFGNGMLMRALRSVALQSMQPAAIVVVNDLERKGAGFNRQQLLKAVDTEWLAWLDSDDEWDPDHLHKLYQAAVLTDSVFTFSYFKAVGDPLGHFGRPFDPCNPHHTTITFLVKTQLALEVGFPDSDSGGPYSNEDWAHITGISKIACERGLKMTHLAERTWTWHHHAANTSGLPTQGDAAW
jgi:hypothetical protein